MPTFLGSIIRLAIAGSMLGADGGSTSRAGADLSPFGGALGLAQFIATAGAGLKHEVRSEPAYRDAVHRLARVTAAAAKQPLKETRP